MDITSTWWNYHKHSLYCLLLWRDIISTSRLLSVLLRMFSTIERYHHHLEEHYQYCRRCSSHWRGKWMINLLMFIIVHEFSVALIIFLCGTNDIPFAILMVSSTFVYRKVFCRRPSLTLMTGVSYGYLGLTLTECNLQDKYKCHLRVMLLQPESRI